MNTTRKYIDATTKVTTGRFQKKYAKINETKALKTKNPSTPKLSAKPLGVSKDYSDYALPILIEESIEMQSAKVNNVSGASYTSESYKKSLASALAKI